MSQTSEDIKQGYLKLLNASDFQTLGATIARRILDSIPRRPPLEVPIIVSRAARSLQINPKPKFSSGVKEGRIAFEEDEKRFVITLNGRYEQARLNRPRRDISGSESPSSLLLRGRFTYAHEVAHRCCFVLSDGVWKPAIDLATEGLGLPDRVKAMRVLTALEEGVCNSAAAKVLIPEEVFLQRIGARLPSNNLPSDESFFRRVDLLSQDLLVSRESLIRRCRMAIQQGVLEIEDNFCILLFRVSDRTSGGRSHWKPRVSIAITPGAFSQGRPHLVSGMEIERLGTPALRFVTALLRDPSWRPYGTLELPVTTARSIFGRTSIPLTASIKGWWQTFGSRRDDGARKVLIWGRLN
jgi:hypothetical protein